MSRAPQALEPSNGVPEQRRFSGGPLGHVFFLALVCAVLALMSSACPWFGGAVPNECASDESCVQSNLDPQSEAYGRGAILCIDGTCRQCREDAECERGRECRNRSCVAIAYTACYEEGVCAEGQICRDSLWVWDCSDQCQCASHLTCAPVGGQCVSTPPSE